MLSAALATVPESREKLIQRVLDSACLPSLPPVAAKLLSITSAAGTNVQLMADLVSQDVSLSVKVLRVVNSAYYSPSQRVASVQQAISILGTNAVRSIVLSFSLLEIRGDRSCRFDYRLFWERSLAAAVSARMITTIIDDGNPDEAFVTGLLLNIGEMILARASPDAYEQALAQIAQGREMRLAEREVLGIDHAEIGHEVASRWGFPDSLTRPILYHHDPMSDIEAGEPAARVNRVAYLAELLASVFYSDRPEIYHRRFVAESRKLLGLDPDQLERIASGVHSEVQRAGEYFGLKLQLDRSVADILQEANEKLAQLNMTYEQMNRELLEAKVNLRILTRELEEKNRRLEDLASRDGLTGVFNHRTFQLQLAREFERARKHERALSLVMLDVDNFKRFNDEHGHQVGDYILKEACKLIAEQLREGDMISRYGGEEFALTLSHTGLDEALRLAEKVRKCIAQAVFEQGLERYHVTMSIGVAATTPATETLLPAELIAQADHALLQAKRRGKNRVVSYLDKDPWYAKILPPKQ
ncbi:MAG: HDOD domain-containing protein [Thiotrichales bacterium]